MSDIVTIPERRRRELVRRRVAIEAMAGELRSVARSCGGRILLLGSAAHGLLTERSDIDLLIDVPASAELRAWSLVGDLARRHDIPADIHSVRTSSPDFVARVEASARNLA